ncbi:hypothetical protein ATCV1_z113L [Acanthocystis turfacea chlorella virus 1]|uniref:Uncharacterized protein z113L n=1 Tax=Chlorovirus heliozoae TaxID=322019 RepID=A7K873_9PHYC|nr:hypothetical protein ATCV1_z113L [Acanthocystis turfacea chlorella virus 1]ABT16247.1 hypothetical protein ATCV1_z113L [Acanthocystis turfacea chlorella virus 1]
MCCPPSSCAWAPVLALVPRSRPPAASSSSTASCLSTSTSTSSPSSPAASSPVRALPSPEERERFSRSSASTTTPTHSCFRSTNVPHCPPQTVPFLLPPSTAWNREVTPASGLSRVGTKVWQMPRTAYPRHRVATSTRLAAVLALAMVRPTP